jgi:hypothetical protein
MRVTGLHFRMVYLPDMDCFLFCVFSVLYCSVTLYYSVLLFFLRVLYCSLFLHCTVSACDVRAATLTEVFPCFYLRCKSNTRVWLAKTEHGTHFPNQFYIFLFLCTFLIFFIVMHGPFSVSSVLFVCKCVLHYCHRVFVCKCVLYYCNRVFVCKCVLYYCHRVFVCKCVLYYCHRVFVCKCVLYYCNRVSIQLQLKINNNEI